MECEDWTAVVTYWGSESGPVEYWCNSCELKFLVNEVVTREWQSQPCVQSAAVEASENEDSQ